jgi:coenzyme F420-0:L-glutamate ligase/coenzyme F420-1:gamma-L-glutamate ligase
VALTLHPVAGIGEVRQGDDLAEALVAATASGPGLRDGDVLVVTSKVVSKAEGRVHRGADREAAIEAETTEVVSEWTGPAGRTVIARTRHGLVLAAAGVDASNTEPGTVVLLPADPDVSAAALRAGIARRAGVAIGVVVSDSMGRPWRVGQTDVAIGAAGLQVVDDLRGTTDSYGNSLQVSVRAVADEIASAAELVAGKTSGVPAVVVRGLAHLVHADDGPGAAALVRPADDDRFRLGTAEAMRRAVTARRTIRAFRPEPVPQQAVLRAVAAALTAPAPHHTTPWRFVLVDSPHARARLLDAMLAAWVDDLRADGLDEAAIGSRTQRGDVLRAAPSLLVPCLVTHGRHPYPDTRRSAAERAMFLLAMGAGIENVLITLAAEGLGSAWVSSTLFCPGVARSALDLPADWEPMGAVAVGYPAVPPAPRAGRDAREAVLVR